LAITFQSASAVGVSALGGDATFNVAYPASIAAGDLLVLIVARKPSVANSGDTPDISGWTSLGAEFLGGGYGSTLTTDAGNTGIKAFSRVADGSETGNLTIDITTTSVAWGIMFRLSNATGVWGVAAATGQDTAAGSVSISFSSDPGVTAGDYILGAMSIPTDVTTPAQFSASALTQTGVTFGTVTEVAEPDTATGSDMGGVVFRAPVTAGTSSAAPVYTATAGGTTTNVRGPGIFIRVRELGGLGLFPGNAAAASSTQIGGVIAGPVALAPSSAIAVGNSLSPAIELSSHAFAPSEAAAVGAVVDPTVELASIALSLGAVEAKGGEGTPSVIIAGPELIAPSAAEASCETLIEEIVLGSGWKFGTESPLSTTWVPEAAPPYSPYA
jgi:hypothetical protein